MKKQTEKYTKIFAILIFIVGLMIRFVRMSSQPLTELEASFAWQAYQAINGGMVGSSGMVAPLSLASISFFLFQPNEFTARFWSVLVGSGVILIPWMWKKELGEKACLIISLGLAIDPLISASTRVLGSPMFAMVAVLSTIGFIKHKQYVLGGIGFALAFLSGDSFWLGIISIGVAWLVARRIPHFFNKKREIITEPDKQQRFGKESLAKLLAGAFVTVLLVGSYFFLNPAGLGSIAAGLVEFLQRITNPSGVSVWQILLALLVYGIFPLVVGVISAWRAFVHEDNLSIILVLWALLSFILVLALPGRQVFDLIWVLIPLYILSGEYLVEVIDWSKERLWLRLAVMLLTLVIFTFVALNIRSFAITVNGKDQLLGLIISLVAGPILLTLSLLLIGIGWDFKQALQGLLYGMLFLGIVLSISSSLSWVLVRSGNKAELWQTSAILDKNQTLIKTVADASGFAYGKPHSAKIVVIGEVNPMLRWTLRMFEQVNIQPFWLDDMQADIIITTQQLGEGIDAEYRGTDISLVYHPEWTGMSAREVFRWSQTRSINFARDKYILWVKTELLPFD